MRFYNQQHRFYCGVDLHARTMYLCMLDHHGRVVYDKNLAAEPDAFLKAVAPFRDDLVAHVLTPVGFALVSSYVELVPDDEAAMIAEDGTGAEYNYGQQGFPEGAADPPTRAWFGEAVLRPDLGW